MRKALLIAAMVSGLFAASSSALAAHATRALPKLATAAPPGYGPAYAVRPHTIWYTGDNTGIIGRIANTVRAVGKRPGFLHWKTWTRVRAYGVGTLWYKSGGGVGSFHRTAVTVTLSEPRAGHFVKMTLRDAFGVDTRCNPRGITYWTIPAKLGSTSCAGAIP